MKSLIGVLDYAIIIITLIVSVGIGFYYKFTGGKQKTLQEYLFADKSMSSVPTALSLMASFVSGLSLLGMPVEVYQYGAIIITLILSYPLCTLFINQFVLPKYFEYNVSTPFEYLYKRFGYIPQLLVSLMLSFQMVLYMGVALYGPSIALEALIGIDELTAVFIVGGSCTLYSVLGGMKAVIIADVFQAIIMYFAVIALLITTTIDAGGVVEFWKTVRKGQRLNFFNFDVDPTVTYTTFSTVSCGAVLFITSHAVGQTQVQRFLAVKDLKTAKRALWISTPISAIYMTLCSLCGLAAFTKYHDCDPVKSGRIRKPDQLMPLFISDALIDIPGLSGMVIAGIFSGTLSSLSSVVNGLAGVTITDYVQPFYRMCLKKDLDEAKSTILVKILVIFYGFLCLFVATMAKYFGGIVKGVMQIFGAVGGPALGIFLLGILSKSCNQFGALVGYVAGNAITLWMSFGGPKPPLHPLSVSTEGCTNFTLIKPVNVINIDESQYFWLYRISYVYTGVVGLIVTLVIGLIASVLYHGLYVWWHRNDEEFFPKSVAIQQLNKLLDQNLYDEENQKTVF